MTLTASDLLDIYEIMLTIRESESRMVALYRAGEFRGHVLPCLGQEAIPAAFAKVLKPADFVVTGHRGGGHYIARGGDLDGLWAELYGKSTGIMRGRAGQMHLVDMQANTIAGNAIVGANWVLGTGAGLAAHLAGRGALAAVFGGEGSTNRGTFHEGLNLAAVKKLPIVFVCEFNQYQLWSHVSETYPVADVAQRAAAYGIPGITVDGNDPLAIYEAAAALAARARGGEGPALLECKTFKWTDSGTNLRLPQEEADAWRRDRDPLALFERRLRTAGVLDAATAAAIGDRVCRRLDQAIASARRAPDPEPGDGLDDVYSLPVVPQPGPNGHLPSAARPVRYVEALRQALAEELRRDSRVFLLGESIGGRQDGIFKVTAGLQAEFGVERVMETPISEAAIAGAATGAAIFGARPVAEIMFNNLLALVGDELHNQAGKFHYLSGGQVSVPMVIRTASWMRVVSGPHHCGLVDAWLMNSPGLKVVAPSCPADAKGLLKAAIRDPDPVVFLEHSALYASEGPLPEGDYVIPLGCADVKRAGKDVTVITYGFLVGEALAAAAQLAGEGIDVEVLDLRTLKPLDTAAVLASVRRTGRAVVAYEGYRTAGAGAEVAALIAEEAIDCLEAPVVRVAAPDVPYPSNAVLLAPIMVDRDDIIAGIRRAWT